MPCRIGCVVEGHGETDAVPALIRRIAFEFDPSVQLDIPHPVRRPRSKLLKEGELERAVQLASYNIAGDGAILVMLDSDDDCPAQLAPRLLRRVREARPDLPSSVVLPKQEFEAWFITAAPSLRGYRGLPANIEPPPDPEAVRGAKEWLTGRMVDRTYAETVDQAAFASMFDLTMARRSNSFDKCYREIVRLLTALGAALR